MRARNADRTRYLPRTKGAHYLQCFSGKSSCSLNHQNPTRRSSVACRFQAASSRLLNLRTSSGFHPKNDSSSSCICASVYSFTSRRSDSNRLPRIYKIHALPAELRRLGYLYLSAMPCVSSKGVEPSLAASSRQCLCHWATRTCGDRSGVRESESRCPRMTLVSRVSRVGSSRSVSRGAAGSRTRVLDHSAIRFSSRVVPTSPRSCALPAKDSNLYYLGQNQASYRLDERGMSWELALKPQARGPVGRRLHHGVIANGSRPALLLWPGPVTGGRRAPELSAARWPTWVRMASP